MLRFTRIRRQLAIVAAAALLSSTGLVQASADGGLDGPLCSGGFIGNHPEEDRAGELRFVYPTCAALQGGDTVTVRSTGLTLLMDAAIEPEQLTIEVDAAAGEDELHPSSVSSSHHELTFTLPDQFQLEPEYSLVFSFPSIMTRYEGTFSLTVETSRDPASRELPFENNGELEPITLNGLTFGTEELYLDLAEQRDVFVQGVYSDDINRILDPGLVQLRLEGEGFASLDELGGVVTGLAQGNASLQAEYLSLTDNWSITVSDYLHDEVRNRVDADRNGLRMDDIIRFVKLGEGLDLNNDGLFDAKDMGLLLYSIDPVMPWETS
jgi:hypothetical protein